MQDTCVILSCVDCPALQYFTRYLINGKILEKKLLSTKYVVRVSPQNFPETFFILRRNERDMVKMYVGLPVKSPLLLSVFNWTWIFSNRYSKNTQKSNLKKIRPVGAELFLCGRADGRADGRKDGWTGMQKLIVVCRNFAKAPRNWKPVLRYGYDQSLTPGKPAGRDVGRAFPLKALASFQSG